MEVSDDMLMALADGELDAPTAASLRAQVARDPDLQRRLAVFTDTAAVLRDTLGAGPVPQRLIDTILAAPAGGEGADVVPLTRPRARLAPWTRAIAAGVVAVGFGFGGWLLGLQSDLNSSPAPWSHYAGSLATGEEMALPEGATLRMLGSYETDQGLCRMASLSGAGLDGRRILCREGDSWHLALSVDVPAGEGFQPASDVLSGLADQWLDGAGASMALEPGAEAAALAE